MEYLIIWTALYLVSNIFTMNRTIVEGHEAFADDEDHLLSVTACVFVVIIFNFWKWPKHSYLAWVNRDYYREELEKLSIQNWS